MGGVCKNQCYKFDVKVLEKIKHRFYQRGLKFCSQCHVNMRYDGTYCPCCGTKMRVTPTFMKRSVKDKYLAQKVYL